jgi:3-dehydroquinate dehydratase/shikimate dehydrogenase
MEEHQALAEKKAELVELRVDYMRKRPDIGRLLKDRPTPVVVTCRRRVDRGRWLGTEEQRQAVLREAIIGGAEYVDLEDDIAKSVRRYGTTKRIVSYHNFEDTPLELYDIHRRMAQCDADIIKIVTMANSPADNVRMLEMVSAAEIPTVGFCMGEMGTISRMLCGRAGSPFTYASYSSERELAPGQLSYAEMRHLYRYNKITKDTKVFGVIGDPIAHSKSPLIHNAAFRKLNVDAVYLPLRIPSDLLLLSLKEFDRLKISGYSVTIPHKEGVLQFCDSMSEDTDLIGAANTLVRHDEKWLATNTDAPAALDAILDGLKKTGGVTELTGRRVLILGAGGVSRAVGYALIQAGAAVSVTNRSRERGRALAAELECQFVSWENRGSEMCEVLINCTSVGMHPNLDESPFEPHWIGDSMLVFDTVYNPEQTLLLKYARERGCPTISGVDMFVRQAAKQFELFTGQVAPAEYMAETLRVSTSAAHAIVAPVEAIPVMKPKLALRPIAEPDDVNRDDDSRKSES